MRRGEEGGRAQRAPSGRPRSIFMHECAHESGGGEGLQAGSGGTAGFFLTQKTTTFN